MSTRLIALFNLKPGITAAEYEAWARAVDLPTVRGLASIEAFTIHRATGMLGAMGQPPYAYVEIIDVADMARFGMDVASEAMTGIAAAFQGMAEVVFLTTEPVEIARG